MIPSPEGWPTKAKETPPHEVKLTPLDTNPVLQSVGENVPFTSPPNKPKNQNLKKMKKKNVWR